MIPDVIGHVTGWREWTLMHSGHLVSWGQGQSVWTDEMEMFCTTREVCKTPQEDHHCGLYAYHEAKMVDTILPGMPGFSTWGSFTQGTGMTVAGIVQGWGEVIVHCDGFRSQYARIVGLVVPPKGADVPAIQRMARLYNARLFSSRDDAEKAAGEFGFPVPEELRPEKPPPPKPEDYDYAFSPAADVFAYYQAMVTPSKKTSKWLHRRGK